MSYTTFSQAFATYLEQEGLTQEQAAGRTGTRQPVIGRIKNGVTPVGDTIQRLSEGLMVVIKHAPGDGWSITK